MASIGSVGHGPKRIDYERWLAYLAGYLDGEGCFRWAGCARIDLCNTFPDTLVEIRRTFGGRIRRIRPKHERHRTQWEWSVSGRSARDVANAVMPFLIEKREQAQILLLIHEFPIRSAQRDRLIARLKALKRIDHGHLARRYVGLAE